MKSSRIIALASLALLFTASCKSSSPQTEAQTETSQTSSAKSEESTEEEGTQTERGLESNPSEKTAKSEQTEQRAEEGTKDGAETSLTLREFSKVGSVDAETLEKEFPAFEVSQKTESAEGIEYQTFVLSTKGHKSVVIEPRRGDVAEVWIHSKAVAGPRNIVVGMNFADVERKAGELNCIRGAEASYQQARCSSDDIDGNIQFIFDVSDVKPPRSKLESADMKGRSLQAIRWWK